MDGDTVPTAFGATSTLGNLIGGNLAAAGMVCDPSSVSFCNNYALPDFSIWTQPGGGPLTLTFPAVSGIGTLLVNDAEAGTPFTASLAVYHGGTLLGTVTTSSDNQGDPVYIGAVDSDGPNITSAIFSLTVAGQTNWQPTSYSYTGYDCSAGHIDAPFCASLSQGVCTAGNNRLACPQKCLCGPTPAATLPYTSTHTPAYPNLTATANYTGTPDTNPTNLADLYIDSVDFAGASSAAPGVPEPHTLHLMGAGAILCAALLHRRLFRRPKTQEAPSEN